LLLISCLPGAAVTLALEGSVLVVLLAGNMAVVSNAIMIAAWLVASTEVQPHGIGSLCNVAGGDDC